MPGTPRIAHNSDALTEAVAVARAAAHQTSQAAVVQRSMLDPYPYKVQFTDAKGKHWRNCYHVAADGTVTHFPNNRPYAEE